MSIDELKKLQLKIIKKNKICNLIAVIFILFTSVITFITTNIELQFFIMLFFFEIIISIIIISIIKIIVNGKNIKLFNDNFKNIFVLNALQKKFNDIVYYSDKGFEESFVNSIGMLDTGDRYYSNDFISGTYKNIKFEQSDIHIEEKHEEKDSDGNKKIVWKTLFKGRLMIFDFNKNFRANIQVSSVYFDAELLPWGKKFSRIRMDDEDFNKNFCVYAQNEHEAFYILTPHFMEKLKEITKELNCGIMFCFVDNKLHVAIDNHEDSFEYNVFKIINEQEIEEKIIKDIKVITDFVDELKLDNDLFRKVV